MSDKIKVGIVDDHPLLRQGVAATLNRVEDFEVVEQGGCADEARYEVLSLDAHKAWNWNRGENKGNGFATTSAELSRALRRNPHLRVLVASGRYDLGTPYSATDWSLAQLDAPADVLRRVTHRYYDAGHMMYTRSADLKQLKADLAGWIG